MFKKIPGNPNYKINLDEVITNSEGEIVFADEKYVEIDLYGKTRKLDKKWLSLYAHFEYDTTSIGEKAIDVLCFCKVGRDKLKTISGYIPYFKEPIEYREGFRIIAPNPHFAVNAKGIVLDTRTNTYVNTARDVGDYSVVYIYDPDRSSNRNVKHHRVIGYAWLANVDYQTKPYINHLDGVRDNNELANLEWCSASENTRHAITTGLVTNVVKMKSRDIQTGEIAVYESLADLGRVLGIGSKDIMGFRYKLPGYLYAKRYEIKELDDDTDWYYENNELSDEGPVKAIYTFEVLDLDTGEVVRINNVKQFIRKYKLWTPSDSIELIIPAFEKKYPNLKVTLHRNANIGPFQVVDLINGVTYIYDSMWKIADFIGIKRNQIQYDLSRKSKFIYNDRWIVVCGMGEYNVEEYSAKVYKSQPVEFTNVNTGEVTEYSSVKLAWRTIGITPRTIYKYLDTGLECKGFIIRTLTAKSVSESL